MLRTPVVVCAAALSPIAPAPLSLKLFWVAVVTSSRPKGVRAHRGWRGTATPDSALPRNWLAVGLPCAVRRIPGKAMVRDREPQL
jgi:hypothetical protein